METKTQLDAMIQKAKAAMKYAYVPRCGFRVGSCLITPDGQFFVGCNIEIASFPLSICAETAAIAAMVSSGYQEIASIIIVAEQKDICPPCGGCRQRIQEFATENTRIHLCSDSMIHRTHTIKALLPFAFDLG